MSQYNMIMCTEIISDYVMSIQVFNRDKSCHIVTEVQLLCIWYIGIIHFRFSLAHFFKSKTIVYHKNTYYLYIVLHCTGYVICPFLHSA